VTAAEIEDLLSRLESVNTSSIDGVVLANLVRACFELGLKKGELIDLSIEDVAKGGIVNDIIRIGDDELNLSELPHAKRMLQDHIEYLKKAGYRLYPTKPLFPTRKKKVRYSAKTLDNHLKGA
jgi:integrase